MTDVELLKALGLTKKSPLSEMIVQTTHHWMKACEEIADLEEKISILLSCKNCSENKGVFICQKEYENKCLAQKIQYIKELQEENAELKEKSKRQSNNYKHDVDMLIEGNEYRNEVCKELSHQANVIQDNLIKAKELLEMALDWQCRCGNGYPTWQEVCAKIEQFLKE